MYLNKMRNQAFKKQRVSFHSPLSCNLSKGFQKLEFIFSKSDFKTIKIQW